MDYDRLREKFEYDQESCRFRHKLSGKGIRKSAILKGKKMNTGYLSIRIDGKDYLYHRAVFLWHHGYLPNFVDHIDRDKANPAIWNLREVTHEDNAANNEASCVERNGKGWCSRVTFRGKRHYLGQFREEDSARAAASNFKRKLQEEIGISNFK